MFYKSAIIAFVMVSDFALKEDAQKRAYENFIKEHKVTSSVQDKPSQRMESE